AIVFAERGKTDGTTPAQMCRQGGIVEVAHERDASADSERRGKGFEIRAALAVARNHDADLLRRGLGKRSDEKIEALHGCQARNLQNVVAVLIASIGAWRGRGPEHVRADAQVAAQPALYRARLGHHLADAI